MAEALGITSSIIAVLQLTNSIVGYCRSMKEASKESKTLFAEIVATRGFLETLKDNLEGTDSRVIKSLGTSDGPLMNLYAALKQLDSKLSKSASASGLNKLGMSLRWPFNRDQTLSLFSVIERQKLLLALALENDDIELSRSIKRDTTITRQEVETIREGVESIMSGVESLNRTEKDTAQREILSWLSSLNPWNVHATILSRRVADTGDWFLKSVEYNKWLAGMNRILFCVGIPGAGKTSLASLVMDDLQTNHLRSDVKIGLAWVYCDYAQGESQNTTSNMCSLLRQLVEGLPTFPQEIFRLYMSHKEGKRLLGPSDCLLAIAALSRMYNQVFVVVDAIDECYNGQGERDKFVEELQGLPENIRLIITSRPIKSIEVEFAHGIQMNIQAQQSDIEKYVSARLESEKSLAKMIKADNDLPTIIKNKITETSKGMFLMSKLHMDDLARKAKRTKREFQEALNKLPEKLDQIYQNAFERIASQEADDLALAQQVLSWVCLSYEPLSVWKLRHAIAIQSGMLQSDEDYLIDSDYLLSVCAGLVPCDNDIVRFVHYTAASYFHQNRHIHFPQAEIRIAHTCVSHLNGIFGSMEGHYMSSFRGPTSELLYGPQYYHDIIVDMMVAEKQILLQKFPLLSYVARYLVAHVRFQFQHGLPDEGLIDMTRKLWLDSEKRITLRAICVSNYRRDEAIEKYALDFYPPLDDLEFAVFFGLKSLVRGILAPASTRGIVRNLLPLSKSSLYLSVCIAAFYGFNDILELLLKATEGVSGRMVVHLRLEYWESHIEIPLTPERLNFALSPVLNTEPAHVYQSWTAVQCAVAQRHFSSLKILLDSAIANKPIKVWLREAGNENPLFLPQSLASPEALAILLKYGFEDRNSKGESLLHLVAKDHGPNVVQFLLDHGAKY
ncbi:hypothetical protein OIDMADRAFT_51391 [Oidiodendron maius Zn]|uniref:Nephrocystin 3-like N-terminal domain-containing protein n=1 Tax=Oidiodendron maius (strain Zn) TaxID=913774 RepID=A0A0C3DN16_OIDMZ|nr:hypothetical protein OIDMADRAFT_51391 [Oidiodendron maius Zn]